MGCSILRMAIAAVLLFLFAIPIAFIIIYGGVVNALFGLAMIGCLAAIQLPLYFILKKTDLLASSERDKD